MRKAKRLGFLKSFTETTRTNGIVPQMYVNYPYCLSVIDNIYLKELPKRFMDMFLNGSGNELKEKACAIHSSSMLAFNFYHWISNESTLVFKDKYEFNKVYFEVQLPTLRGTTPANMDVVLEGERIEDGKKTLLFIESKFTEHFSNASSFIKKMASNSYSRNENIYYHHNAAQFESWKAIISFFSDRSAVENGYFDGVKQEICHLIAISNLKYDEEARTAYKKRYDDNSPNVDHPTITGDELFLFYNILFDADDKYDAGDAYNNYKKLYDSLDERLGKLKSGINTGILSYREIYDSIKDEKLKDYLNNRYMQFAK